MNFADEEYVRLYITDTNTWRMLGWDGQAVLSLMLRRFDRYTGVFEFGRHDPERAIISAIGCPPETARIGLAAILAEGVWVQLETSFYWPTCVEAQTCKRSDKYRKRQQREREARDEMSRSVTSESDAGHADVTTGHADVTEVTVSRQRDEMSRNVTLGKARQGGASISGSPDLAGALPRANDSTEVKQNASGQREDSPPIPPAPPPRPATPAPPPATSEPPTRTPTSESNVVPRRTIPTRTERVRTEWSDLSIQDLARRCRENPHDAGMAGPENRPEVQQVQRAWCEAVGLPIRSLGSLSQKNGALLAIMAALETLSMPDILRACEQAKHDDWAQGRQKGRDGSDGKKCRLEWMSLNVLRRLLDDADAAQPRNDSPGFRRVKAMLEAEKRREEGLTG